MGQTLQNVGISNFTTVNSSQKFNRGILTLPMMLSIDQIQCCKSTYPIDQATEGQVKNVIRAAFSRNMLL